MKTKKSKKRHKNQEELSPKKVNLKESDDNSDDLTGSSNNNIEQNYQAKRKHTKIAKKKKDKDIKESIKVEEEKIKGKKVKFGKIQIINVAFLPLFNEISKEHKGSISFSSIL